MQHLLGVLDLRGNGSQNRTLRLTLDARPRQTGPSPQPQGNLVGGGTGEPRIANGEEP